MLTELKEIIKWVGLMILIDCALIGLGISIRLASWTSRVYTYGRNQINQ